MKKRFGTAIAESGYQEEDIPGIQGVGGSLLVMKNAESMKDKAKA